MRDHILKIGKSIVQHGPLNERVYLMHVDPSDLPGLIQPTESLADQCGYTKIFGKVSLTCAKAFQDRGYEIEAVIPPTKLGVGGLVFVTKFLCPERAKLKSAKRIEEVLKAADAKSTENLVPGLPPSYLFEEGRPADAPDIAELYREVFDTYPFPIQDASYVARCMRENVLFFRIREGNTLVAVSSAEAHDHLKYVEMTDFAVRPQYRGRGLSVFLLAKMDVEMRKRGFLLGYTIARATSFGMNITFAKRGYRHAGTLVNNTNISGGVESMNVWYKYLQPVILPN